MTNLNPDFCEVNESLDILVGKWKPIILLNLLAESPMRFSELKKAIPKITQKMLTKQLRELESQEIIIRKVYAQVPPRVEYSITKYGKTLQPILDAMHEWGLKHKERTNSKITI
ncbi:winged helix-turn-helix transcriptional regulator [Marinilactibacillus psychrotolerans]|uniref:Helix-turn-helix transcriptional regulator n=2 Tax=Marinilactibacillus psychrotolerans TaxID=191770 RepID=A0A511H1A0_9LACT|nr:helix-turn-helix domain-containing protein [Marinilactibacillus psychrotolerans]TLQ08271.1 helix-turn-helix transcriptional regulator [Marinilactibacillus psychrotolerans]SDC63861.1 transcriptional regulator, HxlR family [Marinilactibacillus psychrotolerans]SJN20543.1 Transcriptional regulator, HxlR family [Marinilactibacillus psychrotolerans 42ea]GEL67301.1 transcriptional regulator [Marinilactibacillus psychrotolerans]GEQ32695.1 MarR family transcriptional regulator [Marinilactibacillus p